MSVRGSVIYIYVKTDSINQPPTHDPPIDPAWRVHTIEQGHTRRSLECRDQQMNVCNNARMVSFDLQQYSRCRDGIISHECRKLICG